MSAPRRETVYTQPGYFQDHREYVDALEPCPVVTAAEADELVCRSVARGKIVAMFVEGRGRRGGTRATVVELDDGALVVFHDPRGGPWTPYTAPSVSVATVAAKAVIASGTAYNW